MSKIYKIEAYVVDPNEYYADGEELFETMIDKTDCFCPTTIVYKEATFEWDDDLRINHGECTASDCEEMFNV